MNQTFQNSAQVLSIGIFFTLMIFGLAAALPGSLAAGLEAHGVPAVAATHAAHLPPVSVLFAAFLGYDPVHTLIGSGVISHLSAANAAAISNHTFFPTLIAGPFRSGLHKAFAFAIAACALAALMSWSRGASQPAARRTRVLTESSEPDTI
jgi:hypothetical protein